MQKPEPTTDTKTQILQVARALMQERGYNGFSVQDLADALSIRKASLYHHYPSKDDIVLGLIAEYRTRFERWMHDIEPLPPAQQIHALFGILQGFFQDDRKLCALTMLGSDYNALTPALQQAITELHAFQRRWLRANIARGKASGEFSFPRSVDQMTDLAMSLSLGAQIQARLMGTIAPIKLAQNQVLGLLAATQQQER